MYKIVFQGISKFGKNLESTEIQNSSKMVK